MSQIKRVLGPGFIAGLLAVLAMAIPASASGTKAACVVSGEAKTVDKQDPNLGVRIQGGKGSFVFASLAVACAGVSKGVPDAQVMQATASGLFENVVCGTGKAWGTVTSLAGPPKYRNMILGEKFAIHFVGAKGVFFWHKTKAPKGPVDLKDDILDVITKPNNGAPKPKDEDEKHWHPAGVISLDAPTQKPPPTQVPPNTENCTKAFTASGVVIIEEN